jgi:hypothetical protein
MGSPWVRARPTVPQPPCVMSARASGKTASCGMFQSVGEEKLVTPNTGSLRGDLLALAGGFVGLFTSLAGRGLLHVMVAEGPDSEFGAIARSLRESERSPEIVVESAIARGEIPPGVDPELLGELIVACVIHRFFVHQEAVDDARLERLIDTLLLGVLPRTSSSAPK